MTPERYDQIGRLYQAALERAPAERAAFLAGACDADDELRREVASLLAAHEEAGNFIEQPPDDVAAGWQAAAGPLPRSNFSHYRMLSPLGEGGMGEVWLAEDTRLRRQVAVKLLPAEFTTQPERVRRFAQEARAASALNHPNIITIHEIGEAPAENGGVQYIVTEYVEGETLRQRMTDAPHHRMRIAEAVDVAAQVAAALAAAHEAGITHRDVKPENVMLRRDGYVKVLDFGLAKLTEPPSPAVDSQAPTAIRNSTETGVVMGTPRYMSPEQARGERADARTDIFSLSVLLYEMVAGHAPFVGATTSEMIAAILRDEPLPLASHAPATPPELERIVGKALRKNREERYQTAAALLTDLKQLQRDLEFASEGKKRSGQAKTEGAEKFVVPPSGGMSRQRELPPEGGTTNKGRLVAIITVAALVIAATVAWFYLKRAPVLTSKDAILLADFENRTGDADFDSMLRQGLEMQLQQSPFLSFFPERGMRQTLQLMGRSLDERVTAEIAREICERKNLKALIAGSIAPLGGHYVITLEAINSQSGESLARAQVEVESKEQVLRALSQAAAQLREKLGESLSSIQRADKPIEEVTTSKLEAFRFYSQGAQQAQSGRLVESIPFFKRAAEIDPNFAFAYAHLGVFYGITNRPELAAEYTEKAYALRDRVSSESEKLRYTWRYHLSVTGAVDKSLEVAMLLKRMYPQFAVFNDLANTYNLIGQSDQAITEARESIRLNPYFAPPHRNLGQALLRLNRFAEARDDLAQALQRKLDMTEYHYILYQIAFISGDEAGMQQQLDWLPGNPEEYVAFDWQTGAAAFAGQWRKARGFSQRAIDLTARGDTQEIAARYTTEQALRGAVFGDCQQARADAAQGLKLARGRASLPRAALALALCGEARQAQPLVAEISKRYPEDTLLNSLWLPLVRAVWELQRGNAAQAIEQLQAASRYEAAAEFWPQYLRGQAYLKLGRGAEAAAEFQKILDHRGYAPLSPLYPLAHLGLARAAALTGDAARSQKAYEDFFAAWKEADADLPILREAKREYESATMK